jgi:RND family efflux transporter MFP subunit
MNMKKTLLIAVIIVLALVIVLRLKSNHDKINVQSNKQINFNVVSVSVSTVKRMAADRNISLIGTLATDKELNIAAEMQGKITSLNCEAGQSKTKGSVIATIDDKLKQLAVQTAKVSADKLKKDLTRKENLFKGGTATEQELDDARTSYENAKIQLEDAEKQLSYTKVTAPINGVITQKLVSEGTYLNVGTSIAYIVDISKLKVKLNVSETNVYFLKIGEKTVITAEAYQGVNFEGRISFVSPKGDETHNYPVEIEIVNSAKHPLKAGTFVNVNIKISGSGSGLFIPREALQGSIKDAMVYVAENGKAKLKKIVVGMQNNDELEVLSGLSEGESVITNGQVNLTDDKPVKIINKN